MTVRAAAWTRTSGERSIESWRRRHRLHRHLEATATAPVAEAQVRLVGRVVLGPAADAGTAHTQVSTRRFCGLYGASCRQV